MAESAQRTGWLTQVDGAFGRTGAQSFALEGVLGELQVYGGMGLAALD